MRRIVMNVEFGCTVNLEHLQLTVCILKTRVMSSILLCILIYFTISEFSLNMPCRVQIRISSVFLKLSSTN